MSRRFSVLTLGEIAKIADRGWNWARLPQARVGSADRNRLFRLTGAGPECPVQQAFRERYASISEGTSPPLRRLLNNVSFD